MSIFSYESFSFTQIKKRLRNWPLVTWIILVLSIVLLFAIVQFILRFQLPSPPANLTIKESSPTETLALNKLAELHLFGQNMSNQDLNALPQTSLQLELQGIYSSPSPELGSAIIAAPGETPRVYLAGDTLPGGAVLVDIYEDRVILRRAGQLEVLRLPQHFLETKK